jgi:hypothetical protein
MVTGPSLFAFLNKLVGPHPRKHELRIADMLDIHCVEACDTTVPRFQASTRIRDVIHRVLREEHNDYLVTDDRGFYIGE